MCGGGSGGWGAGKKALARPLNLEAYHTGGIFSLICLGLMTGLWVGRRGPCFRRKKNEEIYPRVPSFISEGLLTGEPLPLKGGK